MARGSLVRRATATANPAADNFGTNILGIAVEQDDYFTAPTFGSKTPDPATAADTVGGTLYGSVIEFRSPYTLTPVKQFYPVERLKGNPSPDPSIPGMQMGAGELHFYLDPTLAPFWLKHLLQTKIVTSTQFTGTDAQKRLLPDSQSLGAANNRVSLGGTTGGAEPKDAITKIRTATGSAVKPPVGMTSGKIKVTIGTAADVNLTVTGKDHNGATVTEVLSFTASPAKTEATTRHWYSDDVFISSDVASQALAKTTLEIGELYEHKLKFVPTVSEGLSLEVREGAKDTPISFNGLLVSRGIFRLEQVARMSLMVIANEAHPRCPLHTDDLSATELDNFSRLDFNAVPAPMMTWEVGGDSVPTAMRGLYRVAQMGLAIDNRFAPPATSNAESFFYPKPVRRMNRELQMQVAIDHSKEADFDQFVGGLPFQQTFSAASKKYGDAYQAIRITGPYSQIINNPTRQVSGVGEILQMIATRMHIGPAAEGNDEVDITVINKRSGV